MKSGVSVMVASKYDNVGGALGEQTRIGRAFLCSECSAGSGVGSGT